MNPGSRLFSNGELASSLDRQLGRITNVIEGINEDRLLTVPEQDLAEPLEQDFLVEIPVLDRDSIATDSVEDGFVSASQFGENVRIRQTSVTFVVPFSGDQSVFTLRPNEFTHSPPVGDLRAGELLIYWIGPLNPDPQAIKQGLEGRLAAVQQWLDWAARQITAYNQQVRHRITQGIQARKARILERRNLESALGFPMRRRSDAATYSVPVTRKKIVPVQPASPVSPFRPEPALADAQYEAALAVLRNQRNALERSPSTMAKLDEEDIRNILLVGLNQEFEGRAAGEVFNSNGKTDILIREGDRNIFIGECKIWRGPKAITEALDQLLGYLVWRDTKAALLLFIRSGVPSEIVGKANGMIREHPNFKRDGQHATDERHDFVLHANGDPLREIKLAFLPFLLPKPPAPARSEE
ncbi:hypothetical protein ACIOUE_26810 [Streptomyces xanthochromogenes]|uniref:hypothetical protein n=1 Tax=Streptomyces xanthochromogenes TaxID=67384 RepID=UPI00380E4829